MPVLLLERNDRLRVLRFLNLCRYIDDRNEREGARQRESCIRRGGGWQESNVSMQGDCRKGEEKIGWK